MKAWLVIDGKPQTFRTLPTVRIVDEFPHARFKDRAIGVLESESRTIHVDQLLNHDDVKWISVFRSEERARRAANALRQL